MDTTAYASKEFKARNNHTKDFIDLVMEVVLSIMVFKWMEHVIREHVIRLGLDVVILIIIMVMHVMLGYSMALVHVMANVSVVISIIILANVMAMVHV